MWIARGKSVSLDSFGGKVGDVDEFGYPSPGGPGNGSMLPSDERSIVTGVSAVTASWKLLGLSDSPPLDSDWWSGQIDSDICSDKLVVRTPISPQFMLRGWSRHF